MIAKRRRSGGELVAVDVQDLPGHLIRLAQQLHKRMWLNDVSVEITSPQYGILNAILAEPGIDQKTAGEEVGIDKSTVGDVVYRLVQRGLVLTFRDPSDQRRNVLHLSRSGRQVVSDLGPKVVQMNRRLIAGLGKNDQTSLVRLLEALLDSAPADD
ncbi:MarR family winged helix-turn-helix transcriptional regulator [Jatrophihabitans cynanchi]|uniref:MarR family winged helix-turn-helix transcriptional regulator n=1 Tax=Jatrophihabitans cynanchi TaxID=2944128 RepID=A0ABY7K0T8_9ACTN|nr:MarR family winged helix-turn-helix transcriptional regulator [Jatrophihabitans sp. SB3-54]WAX58464.1 MarR family winged helix-turn-helix transcriptional regulator [Jatrophihabitans sp. SB3-54]